MKYLILLFSVVLLQAQVTVIPAPSGGGGGGGAVASFNTRTGAVLPVSGDYTLNQVTDSATANANGLITNKPTPSIVPVVWATLAMGTGNSPDNLRWEGDTLYVVSRPTVAGPGTLHIWSRQGDSWVQDSTTAAGTSLSFIDCSNGICAIACASPDNTVEIWDVRNKKSPTKVRTESVSSPQRIQIHAGLLIVGTNNATGVRIYRFSASNQLELVSTISGSASQIQAVGTTLHVLTQAGVWNIYSIADPANPTLTASKTLPSAVGINPNGFLAVDGLTYIVGGISGGEFHVYSNVSTTTPTLVGILTTSCGAFAQLAKFGDYIAMACDSSDNDFKIIDVSDPTTPIVVNDLAIGARPDDIQVSGNEFCMTIYTDAQVKCVRVPGIKVAAAEIGSVRTDNLRVRSEAKFTGPLRAESVNVGPAGIGSFGPIASGSHISFANGLRMVRAVGTGGVTKNLLCELNSAGQAILSPQVSTAHTIGVCDSTQSSGAAVTMILRGLATCVADNTVVAGNLVMPGQITSGRCQDTGATAPSGVAMSRKIIGRAISGASVGGTFSVELGDSTMGTQNVVRTDQANTYVGLAQLFQNTTFAALRLGGTSDLSGVSSGSLGWNETAANHLKFKWFDGTLLRNVASITGTPTNNDCAKFDADFELVSAGAPCFANTEVTLTGQTASISTTNITCNGGICPAGTYALSAYATITTAGTAGTLILTMGWNDGTSAKLSGSASAGFPTSVSMNGTNYGSGTAVLYTSGSSHITYSTSVVGATGSPVYSLRISLRRLYN